MSFADELQIFWEKFINMMRQPKALTLLAGFVVFNLLSAGTFIYYHNNIGAIEGAGSVPWDATFGRGAHDLDTIPGTLNDGDSDVEVPVTIIFDMTSQSGLFGALSITFSLSWTDQAGLADEFTMEVVSPNGNYTEFSPSSSESSTQGLIAITVDIAPDADLGAEQQVQGGNESEAMLDAAFWYFGEKTKDDLNGRNGAGEWMVLLSLETDLLNVLPVKADNSQAYELDVSIETLDIMVVSQDPNVGSTEEA